MTVLATVLVMSWSNSPAMIVIGSPALFDETWPFRRTVWQQIVVVREAATVVVTAGAVAVCTTVVGFDSFTVLP